MSQLCRMSWRKGRLEARAFGIEAQVTSKGRGGNRKGEACLGDRRKISLRLVVAWI